MLMTYSVKLADENDIKDVFELSVNERSYILNFRSAFFMYCLAA